MPRLFLAEQSALAVGGHYFAYSRCVALAARRAGFDVTILQNHAFKGDWDADGVRVISTFHYTWAEAERLWIRNWEPGHIAYDFQEATWSDPPSAGDHVVFTTLGFAEMRALLDYLIELPAGFDHPTYHLLLRYDPAGIRAELDHYKPLFDRMAGSAMLRRIVRFHSDTEPLAADYSDLFGVPFGVLPIPFEQEHLLKGLADDRAPGPLVITYLGDARLEKGFAAIPAAVARLADGYLATGRVRFVIQSNFNTPGGEPGMLQAVQQLSQYPSGMVELVEQPMGGEAYAARLAESDIILIPYDPARYRARSSGILVEAMAAGKPVVTTRGSWMETQVDSSHAVLIGEDADLGAALKAAIDDFEALHAASVRIQPGALQAASADHFVQSLIAASPAASTTASAPLVMVVVDGNALVLRNGFGLVAMNQFKYLTSAGYRVCAVVTSNADDPTSETLETWASAVRARLSPFDLEAVLVAASGRLSFDVLSQRHRRLSTAYSIVRDLQVARSYDISLEAIEFLRSDRIDAVLLNGVVNRPLLDRLGLSDVPVICETHDVQSFQKAIYAKRRVTDEDLDLEMALLAGCRHLISLNPLETAYIHDRLPDAQVTTVGIFPTLPDLGLRALAGIQTIAELIAACGMIEPARDRDPAGAPVRSASLDRIDAIDLLYVSSNHAANVSGLSWFLETVYLPHLAPAGITFAVAGSISDWEWPTHPNLLVLGRLQDLGPLYAAAKVVVLPITEGAGSAVKTIEALTYGRPVVATSVAMRGIEGSAGGVIVANTAPEMVETIKTLLAAPAARAGAAAASLEAGWRLADPAVYARIMDGIFKEVMGPDALTSSTPPSSVPEHVEPWSDRLRDVNRLARLWLQDEPLEQDTLFRLAGEPIDDTLCLLEGVLAELVIDRKAACLASMPHVLVAAASRTRQDVDRYLAVVGVALQTAAPPAPAADDSLIALVCEAALAVTATVTDLPGKWTLERPGLGDPLTAAEDGTTSLIIGPRSADRADLDHVLISSPVGWRNAVIEVSQSIPLDGTYSPKGHGAVLETGEREASMVLLRSGEAIRVAVPELFGTGPLIRMVDFWIDAPASIDLEVIRDGRSLAVQHFRSGGRHLFRVSLDGVLTTPAVLSVDVIAGSGVLRQVDNVLSSTSIDGLVAKAYPDMERIAGTGDQESGPASPIRGLEPIIEVARAGRALPRYRLAALRDRIVPTDDQAEPADVLSAAGIDPRDVDHVRAMVGVDPSTDPDQPSRRSWVASAGLSGRLIASFPPVLPGARIACAIDGMPCEGHASDNQWSWSFSGEAPGDRPVWRRDAEFSLHPKRSSKPMRWKAARFFILRRLRRLFGVSPQQYQTWLDTSRLIQSDPAPVGPTSAAVVYRFPAGLDPSTHDQFARLSNAYHSEDTGLVWTGPGRVSVFTVPLALSGPGTLEIGVANLGVNVGVEDIEIALNGEILTVERRPDGSDFLLRSHFSASALPLATTELAIRVKRVGQLGGDHRQLGIAVTFIQMSQQL